MTRSDIIYHEGDLILHFRSLSFPELLYVRTIMRDEEPLRVESKVTDTFRKMHRVGGGPFALCINSPESNANIQHCKILTVKSACWEQHTKC